MTCDIEQAKKWFFDMAGGLDGVIAKKLDIPYQSGNREGMQKIKNLRTADCVVGGFRYATKGKYVGSLLLGLYDEGGLLHHVGFTSAIAVSEREALTRKLETSKSRPDSLALHPAARAAGLPNDRRSGSRFVQNSWWKCSTITSPADVFDMARNSFVGVRIKSRNNAQ